ncbi:flagellar hook protein FlgE [Caloramator quimbayensis]|uniref:Flagellar hook protein FlgE n=1 Tax=Caloramator quimbayensis TaxID=1147123 RepID=A0A1T4XBR9_9CLOT|nr:flagellar hook-basal body complex protein [Caloramator quimbayensis]SKA86401.1 flagellar hook protein FlgE [Caloramator quimbayensis]
MLRSLFSGVSGMKSQQTKLDVIGNNIANVNTTSFKSARVTFKDMLSQTLQGASAPAGGKGGTNPKQAGLGVSVAAIDTNMTQGALQPTGRATDLAIEGNGFFIVSDGIEKRYTRDGAFSIDKDGYLITSEGLHVMGFRNDNIDDEIAEDNIPTLSNEDEFDNTDFNNIQNIRIPLKAVVGDGEIKLTSIGIDKDGMVKAIYGDTTVKIGQIVTANFQNPVGLYKNGGNTYSASSNSGEPQLGLAASSGYGTIQQGILEMSNVDLANEFTEMIITSRAFQANSRTITTSDEILQELLNLKR